MSGAPVWLALVVHWPGDIWMDMVVSQTGQWRGERMKGVER